MEDNVVVVIRMKVKAMRLIELITVLCWIAAGVGALPRPHYVEEITSKISRRANKERHYGILISKIPRGGISASATPPPPSKSDMASSVMAETSTETSTSTTSVATATAATTAITTGPDRIIRVAYQGEPGAYSEKSTRELLGKSVIAVGYTNFESCFRAVASMECDYACLPIENSLGGSIHENYDLMLRYDLTIVAEHEFRVHHCLLAKPGIKREDIKYAISHPQALAQCDNFLRGLGIQPIPTYDTAGSAKMISEQTKLPGPCTAENTAAIASDLAGKTYGLHCLDVGIEDDDTNFTRFLLLARKDVSQYLNKNIPAKTSIVFTLPDSPGALYKALACFSLRDIDFSKIESRPTSASLLNFLKFKSQQAGNKSRNKAKTSRFRYCFYLDFLANQLDQNAQNAISHLREQADYMRILGSYPQKSRLVGPVAHEVEKLRHVTVDPNDLRLLSISSSAVSTTPPLSIGIIGFHDFGRFLARRFLKSHRVSCLDTNDKVSVISSVDVGSCVCCMKLLSARTHSRILTPRPHRLPRPKTLGLKFTETLKRPSLCRMLMLW
jgi:arogenate/prephenate dehydratase